MKEKKMPEDYEFKIKVTGAEGRGGWHELYWLLKDCLEKNPNAIYDYFEPILKEEGKDGKKE